MKHPLEQTYGQDFGRSWSWNRVWNQVPWPMWCLECCWSNGEAQEDCSICSNTRRHPIPFSEVWGL